MINQETVQFIIDEMDCSEQKRYLTALQVQIVKHRMLHETTYIELCKEYNLSSNLALSHCLIRTSKLLFGRNK